MTTATHRHTVARLTEKKAALEADRSKVMQASAKLSSNLATLHRDISRSSNRTAIESKQRQIVSKMDALAREQKQLATLEGKIADVMSALARTLKSLEADEERDQRTRATQRKRQQQDEMSHTKAITHELSQQAALHATIQRSRFVIDLASLPPTIKVLLFAANPRNMVSLYLDEEIRQITQKIRASHYRDSVQLIPCLAAQAGDLLQALNEHQPHIVHFSGHGTIAGETIFLDSVGDAKPVSQEAIVLLIGTMADHVRLVIFNTCLSESQAQAVTQYVDVAIGMRASVNDQAARVFAAAFYRALGFGRSIQNAFDQGKAELLLEDLPDADAPTLCVRDDVDPHGIILVRPPANNSASDALARP